MQFSLNVEQRQGMLRRLRADDSTSTKHYLATARAVLMELVGMRELIQRLPLNRKKGGYARTLLAGDEQVSIYAIAWDAGSATSIHDHHCSCCFGLVSGFVTETWFRAIDGQRAVPTEEKERAQGYVACMLPSGPNIHRMSNRGSGEAISIHIYGFDHERYASSIDAEYVGVTG